jgi:hypothetical protein
MRGVMMNDCDDGRLHHFRSTAPGLGDDGGHEDAARQIRALLRANMGIEVCLRCICTTLKLDPDAAQAGMLLLASNTAYRHERWICARCRRTDDVIRAVY